MSVSEQKFLFGKLNKEILNPPSRELLGTLKIWAGLGKITQVFDKSGPQLINMRESSDKNRPFLFIIVPKITKFW